MDFDDFPTLLGKSGCRSRPSPRVMCRPRRSNFAIAAGPPGVPLARSVPGGGGRPRRQAVRHRDGRRDRVRQVDLRERGAHRHARLRVLVQLEPPADRGGAGRAREAFVAVARRHGVEPPDGALGERADANVARGDPQLRRAQTFRKLRTAATRCQAAARLRVDDHQ